jgi:hypothetical protein
MAPVSVIDSGFNPENDALRSGKTAGDNPVFPDCRQPGWLSTIELSKKG